MVSEYPMAREPTPAEWNVRRVFLEMGRSVPKTAFELGLDRGEVLRAVAQCRWYLQDLGWDRRYRQAISVGMSQADARLHADMEAAYNLRSRGSK